MSDKSPNPGGIPPMLRRVHVLAEKAKSKPSVEADPNLDAAGADLRRRVLGDVPADAEVLSRQTAAEQLRRIHRLADEKLELALAWERFLLAQDTIDAAQLTGNRGAAQLARAHQDEVIARVRVLIGKPRGDAT